MKLNEATVFFATMAVIYGIMSVCMLFSGCPVMALLGVFVVVLSVLIIKIASDDNG